jgi:DNA-binding transcriptional regulator LsrR (DeoR family)
MNSSDTQRLLFKVSRLYYEEELTQNEIGEQMGISRQKVQRLLDQARREGVVQIKIRPILGTFAELEGNLERRFGLQEAIVVETSSYDDQPSVAREVGGGAAAYLARILQPGNSIAISWGGSLLGMVNALQASPPDSPIEGVKVIQGLGGLGDPNNEVHAMDLTRRLAQVLGGRSFLLPAPGVVGKTPAREALYQDPHISQALALARSADLAFMGIGAPRPDSILMREGRIVQWNELAGLIEAGAVGDINLRYFDRKGRMVASDLDRRVIGLTLDEIRQIQRVVGVAGGSAKYKAIQGALEGGFLNVLVTDHRTAERLLADSGEEERPR